MEQFKAAARKLGKQIEKAAKAEKTANFKRDTAIKQIAEKELSLETLEERKMDDLDFHQLSVWEIKSALEAAYEAGKRAGR